MAPVDATSTRGARRRHEGDLSQTRTGAVSRALGPVVEAILASARSEAEDVRAAAAADERVELSKAHGEAVRTVDQGRAQGVSAAAWISSLQLAAARREARQIVLAARRRAYEKLRHDAVEALVRRSSTPEGRALSRRLAVLVGELIDAHVPEEGEGFSGLELEVESVGRRVSIGPEALVDHVLSTMSEEVEALWA